MKNDIKLFDVNSIDQVNPFTDPLIVKEQEYKDYIDRHIKYVKKSYNEMIDNDWLYSSYNSDIIAALDELKYIIDDHDASKYSDDEFYAYRQHFYPIEGEEDNEEAYEEAWKHHYTVNDHHPEHWIVDGQPTNMSMRAILEMICDWQSFAYINKGTASDFWYNNPEGKAEKSKIMTSYTINTVERILKLLNYKEN